jgi:hypothetical protein
MQTPRRPAEMQLLGNRNEIRNCRNSIGTLTTQILTPTESSRRNPNLLSPIPASPAKGRNRDLRGMRTAIQL